MTSNLIGRKARILGAVYTVIAANARGTKVLFDLDVHGKHWWSVNEPLVNWIADDYVEVL